MKTYFQPKTIPAGLICLVMVLLSARPAAAQNDDPAPRFGVKGGLNLSSLIVNDPNVESSTWKAGYHAGVYLKIPLTHLQPELLYSNTGSGFRYGNSGLGQALGVQPSMVRFDLSYVQLPALFMINLGPFNVHAGPYGAYLLNASLDHEVSNDLSENANILNLNQTDFQRFDFGVAAGVGYDLRKFRLGVRYNHGFGQLGDGGIADRLTGNARNAVAQVYAGFSF
jgi:hypothetical protein